MGTVFYNIVSGLPDFIAELTPSNIAPNVHTAIGEYYFENVPNGGYTLKITDANNCVYTEIINVNPSTTTTTSTTIPSDLIVVGNTNDTYLIFNEDATNRSTHYSGFPNIGETYQYLWLKTSNGSPLVYEKHIKYQIASNYGIDSVINIIESSDQINCIVSETIAGPELLISGDIILKRGFIETFIKYKTDGSVGPEYQLSLNSIVGNFDTTVPLINITNIYGITYTNSNNIIMNF